jgi:hypothetical protein
MNISKNNTITKKLPFPKAGWLAFFLLWPFGALLMALRRFRSSQAKTIFWLFCIYFGFVFVYPKDTEGTADSSRYAAKLVSMHEQPTAFSDLVQSIYNTNEGLLDVYQPLTTWFIALFTGNANWLFLLFAAVFGFFYTQNIWLIISRIEKRIGLFHFLFLLAFALTNPIWYINGVRMWTAAQIYLYGSLLYFLEGNRKGIIWILLTPLFHFSFLFPVIIFFVYLVLPNYIVLFFIFFVATSFVNEINIPALREQFSFLPDIFQPKINTYLNEDYLLRLEQARENFSWHAYFASLSARLVLYIWTITAFFLRKYWLSEKQTPATLFSFALFLGGWANLSSLVPSGGRLHTLANGFFYASFILIFLASSFSVKINLVKYITFPFLLFSIIFSIRVGLDYIGILTVLGNPITAILGFEQTPLIQFIKQML